MTTVRMILPISTPDADYRPGVNYSLADALAAQWIANGWAGLPTAGVSDPASFVQFRGDVSAVSGAGGLSTIVTVGLTVPQVISFTVAGEPHDWELVAGTNATDGITYQRPNDYGVSNQVVWRRRS